MLKEERLSGTWLFPCGRWGWSGLGGNGGAWGVCVPRKAGASGEPQEWRFVLLGVLCWGRRLRGELGFRWSFPLGRSPSLDQRPGISA